MSDPVEETNKAKDIKETSLDDKDLLEKIKEEKSESLKQKLLSLNDLNNKHISISDHSYHDESKALRQKYETQYIEIYNQIRQIINTIGTTPEIKEEEYDSYAINHEQSNLSKPIEDFWIKCLENAEFFVINDKDKEILTNLVDIRIILTEQVYDFTIEFEFKDNDFLTNKVLSKTYCFDKIKDKVISSTKTIPEWKDESKNPAKKTKIKNVKKGKSKQKTTIVQDVDSFFDIFNSEKTKIELDDTEARFIREDLLPNSLEYYMGIIEIQNGCDDEDCEDEKCTHKH